MKKFIKRPLHIIALNPEDYNVYMKSIISNKDIKPYDDIVHCLITIEKRFGIVGNLKEKRSCY